MRRIASAIIALLLAATAEAPGSALAAEAPWPLPTVSATHEDAELLAAHARARATLSRFIERLRQPRGDDVETAVCILIRQGEHAEYAWLTDVTLRDGRLRGRLDAAPQRITRYRAGQILTVAATEIVDWLITVRRGKRIERLGGYTLDVLNARERRGLVPDHMAFDGGVI